MPTAQSPLASTLRITLFVVTVGSIGPLIHSTTKLMRQIFRIINRKTTSDTFKAKSYVEMQAKTRIIRDVHFDSIGVKNSKKVLSTVINGDYWESYDLRESCDLPGVPRFVNGIKLTKKNKCQQKPDNKNYDCRGCKTRHVRITKETCVGSTKKLSAVERSLFSGQSSFSEEKQPTKFLNIAICDVRRDLSDMKSSLFRGLKFGERIQHQQNFGKKDSACSQGSGINSSRSVVHKPSKSPMLDVRTLLICSLSLILNKVFTVALFSLVTFTYTKGHPSGDETARH